VATGPFPVEELAGADGVAANATGLLALVEEIVRA
jgi:hypothetical protein